MSLQISFGKAFESSTSTIISNGLHAILFSYSHVVFTFYLAMFVMFHNSVIFIGSLVQSILNSLCL
jgi:hypothetical protein